MATIAETGVPSALGPGREESLASAVSADGSLPVAVISGRDGGLFSDRTAATFRVQPDELIPNEEGKVSLAPKASNTTKSLTKEVRGPLHHVFDGNWKKGASYRESDTLITDDTPVDLGSAKDLREILQLEEERPGTVAIIGETALTAFVQNGLGVLDIHKRRPYEIADEGFTMTGDDKLASSLVQIAYLAGLDVARHIPPEHRDRAIAEIVTKTVINNFFWLSRRDRISITEGLWQDHFAQFAEAYEVRAEEVADFMMIYASEIHEAANAHKGNRGRKLKKHGTITQPRKTMKSYDEETALLAAKFLVAI